MSVRVRGPKNLICGDGELCSWSEDGVALKTSYDVFVVRVVGVEWFAFVTSCWRWDDCALGGCFAVDAIEVICSIIWCGFQVIWGNDHLPLFPRF